LEFVLVVTVDPVASMIHKTVKINGVKPKGGERMKVVDREFLVTPTDLMISQPLPIWQLGPPVVQE